MSEAFVDSGTDWDRPILVGCCPSSGSTLLSVILDTHPKIFSGPELAMFSHPFLWNDQGQDWRERVLRYSTPATELSTLPDWSLESGVCPWIGFCNPFNFSWYGCDLDAVRARVSECDDIRGLIDFVFRGAMQAAHKSIWVEKSPTNLYALPAFLERYPRGRGVVMMRDGRDVVCSLMKRGFDFARAASIWVVEAALTLVLSKHPRVHLLRYEDLVADPRPALRGLMDFLELEASLDQLLDYQNSRRARDDATIRLSAWKNSPQQAISTGSVGRWQDELSAFHTFVLENVRLGPTFPALESMSGKTGRDILVAGGYAPGETCDLDARQFIAWLLEERSTLQSLADPVTFHFRHASLFGAARANGWPLVPAIAKLVDDVQERDAKIEALEKELAKTHRYLHVVTTEMERRSGVRYGVKESVRSIWNVVRRRPAG